MKITQIDVYQINYKLLDRKYAWSRGHAVTSFVSTIVKISTDVFDLSNTPYVKPYNV
jgi:hypothetical protein